jgi:D-alanine--poly(phosphoribitol) ligase subunit 2
MREGEILQLIYEVIDEMNEQLPEASRLDKSPGTILLGASGKLDSLGLVNLITLTEQKVEDAFGTTVVLADERALSEEESPFQTVASLSAYICSMLP